MELYVDELSISNVSDKNISFKKFQKLSKLCKLHIMKYLNLEELWAFVINKTLSQIIYDNITTAIFSENDRKVGYILFDKNITGQEANVNHLYREKNPDRFMSNLVFFKNKKLPKLEYVYLSIPPGNTQNQINYFISSFFPPLKNFFLSCQDISCELFEKLMSNFNFSELEKFGLQLNKTNNYLQILLKNSFQFKKIKSLTLLNISLDSIIFWDIISEHLLCLKEIILVDNNVENFFFHASRIFFKLKKFILDENLRCKTIPINNTSNIFDFLNGEQFPVLEYLELHLNTPVLLHSNFKPANFPFLKNLILKGVNLNNQTLSIFLLGSYQSLEHLDLSYNKLTDKGAEKIFLSTNFPVLKYLDLAYNKIGYYVLSYLNTLNLLRLTKLVLLGNNLDFETINKFNQCYENKLPSQVDIILDNY
jgi:hypothetical protein